MTNITADERPQNLSLDQSGDQSRSGTMRALVANRDALALQRRPRPRPRSGQVVVEVAVVGLCRTDLRVIDGQIPARRPIIPGHEFAGRIVDVGAQVDGLSLGQQVAVNPVIACGRCKSCETGDQLHCSRTRFLGLDLDGACADFIVLPAAAVTPTKTALPSTVVAFAEPVAASMAVVKTGIEAEQHGVILGRNRIAELTARILVAHGFGIRILDAREAATLGDNAFDFAIETLGTTQSLETMARLVRPRGRIVFKSRQFVPLLVSLREMLPKEQIWEFANYAPFDQAVTLLSAGRIDLDDLIGDLFPIDRYEDAIAAARGCEQKKTFLKLAEV